MEKRLANIQMLMDAGFNQMYIQQTRDYAADCPIRVFSGSTELFVEKSEGPNGMSGGTFGYLVDSKDQYICVHHRMLDYSESDILKVMEKPCKNFSEKRDRVLNNYLAERSNA